jgi:hypothetical protein
MDPTKAATPPTPPPGDDDAAAEAAIRRQSERLDEELDETFPASDPIPIRHDG